MTRQPERGPEVQQEQLSRDAQILIERIAGNTERPVVLLLGSALTMQLSPGESGVPDVRKIVSRLRAILPLQPGSDFDQAVERAQASNSGKDFGVAYREGFAALIRLGGQDAANRIIREAVLEACNELTPVRRERLLRGHPDDHTEPCSELLETLDDWKPLRASVAALGEVLAQHKKMKTVLTTNFDPLIELAVRRASGGVHRTVLDRDGSPGQHSGHGIHVVYLHGYWFGADTLHTNIQIQKERLQLTSTLRRWIDRSLLIVMGYGGWDDVLMRSLQSVIADSGAYPDIAWAFFGSTDQDVVQKLNPQNQRVQFYEHVDMHTLLPRLRDRLRRIQEEPRATP